MQERGREGTGWGWAALAGLIAVLAVLVAPRTEGPTEAREMVLAAQRRAAQLAAEYRALPVPPVFLREPTGEGEGRRRFTKAAAKLYGWTHPALEGVDPDTLTQDEIIEIVFMGGRESWTRAKVWLDGLGGRAASMCQLGATLAEAASWFRPLLHATQSDLESRGVDHLDVLLPDNDGAGFVAINEVDAYLRLVALHHRLEGRPEQSLHATLDGYAFAMNLSRLSGAILQRVTCHRAAYALTDLEVLLAHAELSSEQLAHLAEVLDQAQRALPDVRRERLAAELVYYGIAMRPLTMGPTGPELRERQQKGFRASLRPSNPEAAVLAATEPSGVLLRALWDTTEGDDQPQTFAIILADTWDLRLRLQTRLSLLAAHVAIQRFEREHGQRPTSLDALVPRWLPAKPTCAYSEQPLRFDGQRVWAYGQDGDDDRGLPLQWSYDGPRPQNGDLISVLPAPTLGPLPDWFTELHNQRKVVADAWAAYEEADARMDAWIRSDETEDTRPPDPVVPETYLDDLSYHVESLVDGLARAVVAAKAGDDQAYERARRFAWELRTEYGFLDYRHGDMQPLSDGDPHERYVEVATRWWIWAAAGWCEIEWINASLRHDELR